MSGKFCRFALLTCSASGGREKLWIGDEMVVKGERKGREKKCLIPLSSAHKYAEPSG